MTTVGNIISVLGLPILGAVVDYTSHRKLLGQILISIAVLGNLAQVGISEDTWVVMAAIQAILKIFIDGHQLCMFAYIGELSQNPEKELPQVRTCVYGRVYTFFLRRARTCVCSVQNYSITTHDQPARSSHFDTSLQCTSDPRLRKDVE